MKAPLILAIFSMIIAPQYGRFPFAIESSYEDFTHTEIIKEKCEDRFKYSTDITNTGDELINIISTNLRYFKEIDNEIYSQGITVSNYDEPTFLAKNETARVEFLTPELQSELDINCYCYKTTKYESFDISSITITENNNRYDYTYQINNLGDSYNLKSNHTLITELISNGTVYRFESYQHYSQQETCFTTKEKLDLDSIKVTAIYAAEGLDKDYYDKQDMRFYGIIATVIVFGIIVIGLIATAIILPIITFKKKNKEN